MNLTNLDLVFKTPKCLNLCTLRRETHNVNKYIDLSLCYFVWTGKVGNKSYTFMSIFDLNQWYKEEMPRKLEKSV